MQNISNIIKLISFTIVTVLLLFMIKINSSSAQVISNTSTDDNITFAVISDVHIKATKAEEDNKLTKALRIINSKAPSLDAMVIAGDLTDHGQSMELNRFKKIYENNCNSNSKKLFVMGNHDFGNGFTVKNAKNQFEKIMDIKTNTHEVINGYHFIQVNSVADNSNSNKKEWIKEQIEIAVKEDKDKPIFITTHEHISGTVYGSDEWGYDDLYEVLKDYPQIITFTGHSHYSIQDERDIHQKDFTSIGTGSLSYMELEKGKIDGSVPKGAKDISTGLLVKVNNKNEVIIERLDFTNNLTIKEPWRVNLDKEKFEYTDERANKRKAPKFKLFSKVDITNITSNKVTITFKQATHKDFVHSYRIEIEENGSQEVKQSFSAFSEFYKNIVPEQLTFNIDNLNCDTTYKIKVYAIESFGNESKNPIEGEFTTAK
ncbi:MAG: metallophosphoesterase [Clostridium sp.]